MNLGSGWLKSARCPDPPTRFRDVSFYGVFVCLRVWKFVATDMVFSDKFCLQECRLEDWWVNDVERFFFF